MPKCRLACIDPKVDVRSTRAKRFDDLYVSAIDGPHERLSFLRNTLSRLASNDLFGASLQSLGPA